MPENPWLLCLWPVLGLLMVCMRWELRTLWPYLAAAVVFPWFPDLALAGAFLVTVLIPGLKRLAL